MAWKLHQIANVRLSLNGEFAIEMTVFELEMITTNHQPFSNSSCRTEQEHLGFPFSILYQICIKVCCTEFVSLSFES